MSTETDEQKAFVSWFRESWPEHERALRVRFRGINLGSRKRAYMMVKYMENMGSVDGESDICIAIPRGGYGCAMIEHKGENQPHKLSNDQYAYLQYHKAQGNWTAETRGLESLRAAVEHYMSLDSLSDIHKVEKLYI